MSEQNKQIVERVNAAFTANDMEGFLEHCAEDVVWLMAGEGAITGKKAVREFMNSMKCPEPPVFTVDRLISDDKSVVCCGDMKMKEEGGTEGAYSYCDVYQFEGSKITELRSYVVKQKEAGSVESASA